MSFPIQAQDGHDENPIGALFLLIGLCILLGTTLAAFFSNIALKPIRKVIGATNKIAEGDFSVRVNIKGIHELEELSGSFNKMAQELASIETLRNDFINDFSHEFKTPIVSVRGFAKLLKEGDLSDEEKQEYIDIIITESERLATLSTNILNLSKNESIGIITDKTPFRLDEQIRRVVVLTEPKWSTKDITMNVNMEEVIFVGNKGLTQQIWLNLLDNAIKFSEKGSPINIDLSKWSGGIRFTIKDDGIGFDDAIKTRIFDKFYQGDPSHNKSGNGLGLAIVKKITELCGGTIEVQSELGKGSAFTIMLPNE
jgi:signal transduction histidine kinase